MFSTRSTACFRMVVAAANSWANGVPFVSCVNSLILAPVWWEEDGMGGGSTMYGRRMQFTAWDSKPRLHLSRSILPPSSIVQHRPATLTPTKRLQIECPSSKFRTAQEKDELPELKARMPLYQSITRHHRKWVGGRQEGHNTKRTVIAVLLKVNAVY